MRRNVMPGLTLFACLLLLWVCSCVWVTPNDLAHYRHLLTQWEHAASGALPESTQQLREGVRKDIWLAQEEGPRLHWRLEADHSQLSLASNQLTDIVEHLHQLRCWMQEKEQVRCIEAAQGEYQYATQQFHATDVILSLFRANTFAAPLPHPFLKGIAQQVHFSVSGNTPRFEAHQFKALLNQ